MTISTLILILLLTSGVAGAVERLMQSPRYRPRVHESADRPLLSLKVPHYAATRMTIFPKCAPEAMCL